MSVKAIYPGTFDPITHGHTDIIRRASCLFDEVYVAVADPVSTEKNTCFNTAERLHLVKTAVATISNVTAKSFNTLATHFAQDMGASVMIRGLRAVSDFDYEFQMASMNRRLLPGLETVFLATSENVSFVSSSLIRQIASLGGDVTEFVDSEVATALKERLGK